MNFIKNILFVILIFSAGFYAGNLHVFENNIKKDLVDENITDKKIEPKVLEAKKIHIKEIVPIKEVKKEEKKYSNYEMFEQFLHNNQYKEALDIYQYNSTNDDIEKYQTFLFNFAQNLILQKDENVSTLVNKFLKIEYDHPYFLYLKSQIYFQKKRYKESFSILNNLKIYELEKNFEKNILLTLDEYRLFYIKKLQNQKEYNKLIEFLNGILEEESYEVKYIYYLAKVHFDLKNYYKSKELLERIPYDDAYANSAKSIMDKINKKIKRAEKFSNKIQLQKNGNHFVIKAILNNNREVSLLVDTGASITLIDESIINEIEHKIVKNNIKMNTAGGIATAKLVQLNSFEIEETSIDKMQVTSSPLKGRGFDGLLGMNYLGQFDFYIDQKTSILYLNKK